MLPSEPGVERLSKNAKGTAGACQADGRTFGFAEKTYFIVEMGDQRIMLIKIPVEGFPVVRRRYTTIRCAGEKLNPKFGLEGLDGLP